MFEPDEYTDEDEETINALEEELTAVLRKHVMQWKAAGTSKHTARCRAIVGAVHHVTQVVATMSYGRQDAKDHAQIGAAIVGKHVGELIPFMLDDQSFRPFDAASN